MRIAGWCIASRKWGGNTFIVLERVDRWMMHVICLLIMGRAIEFVWRQYYLAAISRIHHFWNSRGGKTAEGRFYGILTFMKEVICGLHWFRVDQSSANLDATTRFWSGMVPISLRRLRLNLERLQVMSGKRLGWWVLFVLIMASGYCPSSREYDSSLELF